MKDEQLELDIAIARNRKATTWKNTRVTWGWLRDRLARVERSGETLEEYLAWPKDRQDDAKDAGGFVGGFLVDGKRRRGHVKHRQVLALDVDNDKPGLPAWEAFKAKHAGVAALLYSTRKHRPASPRYRVVIPLDREVTPDEYQAIGRAVAGRCGIDAFDDSTYDATRLMYWPTACADGEVLFEEVEGDPLPAGEALAWLADWRDCSTWPRSSRELEAGKSPRNREGATVADPRGKSGVVGAFCRCYTVPGVIENFLLETYDPVEGHPDRYTFCGASTSGGLVVYDEVLAYSHHATDPAGGRLLNAFDLARIHLHGHLDARWDDSRPVTTAPSFTAMVEIVGNLPNVKREVLRELQEGFLQAFEDDGDEEGEEDDDSWKEELETAGKRGRVLPTIANASLILARDPRLKGRFGFDRFARRELIMKRPPWDEKGVEHYPRDRRDNDEISLRAYIEANYKLQGRGAVSDALALAFQAAGFHPLRAYLDKLQWDGVERVDTLFVRLFGASDTPYTRAVTRKILCAAIARAYRPGTRFDYMVVFSGAQGIGKSTVIKQLGGPWYNDRVTMTGGKEAMEQLRGSWICEWGEMRGIRAAEYEAMKLFISSPVDRYRPAYGHVVEAFPRQCVFFATTNEETPLTDPTGGRRFWIVKSHETKITLDWNDLTPELVGQIWAEAKARYHLGEKLYLDPELEKKAVIIQEEHRESDAWQPSIEEYLANAGIDRVCSLDIWEKALLVDKPIDLLSQRRIANVMRNVKGWQRGRYHVTTSQHSPVRKGWIKVKEGKQ